MMTFTELTKSKCGTCGRDVAIVKVEVRERGERRESELRVSRHLRSSGFCKGSLATHTPPPRNPR